MPNSATQFPRITRRKMPKARLTMMQDAQTKSVVAAGGWSGNSIPPTNAPPFQHSSSYHYSVSSRNLPLLQIPTSSQYLTHIKLDHFLGQLPSLTSDGLPINLWMLLANGFCQSQTLNWKKNPLALNGQQSPLEETPTAASTSTRHPILQVFLSSTSTSSSTISSSSSSLSSLCTDHCHNSMATKRWVFFLIRFCCNSY